MDILGRGIGWGGAPKLADIFCWFVKFPPVGVGFCIERYLTNWGGVPPSGGGPEKVLPTKTFLGIHHQSPHARDHSTVSQPVGAGDS